jgi:hypothetical protein
VVLASALLAAVLAVVGAALVGTDRPVPTAGARVRLDGSATVVRADGASEALRDGDVVGPGDEIEVTAGTMVLELAAGGTVEGRAGFGGARDTLVEVGAPVRLLAGDVLASGEGSDGVAVAAAGTVVTVDGGGSAARVSRDLAVTTGTFRGSAIVDSAGERREVPALRQLSVASVGRPTVDLVPLRYGTTDAWDRRFLDGVGDLGDRLLDAARSFSQASPQLSAGELRRLLPGLDGEQAFDASLIRPDRTAGETLVGAAIALLADDGGDLATRWDAAFGFRDEGADWGLVALDGRADGDAVLGEVAAAFDRLGGSVTSGESAAGAPGALDDPAGDAPGGGGGSTGGATPAPTDPAAPLVTVPAPTTPPVTVPPLTAPTTTVPSVGETVDDVLDGLVDPVEDLVGGVLG